MEGNNRTVAEIGEFGLIDRIQRVLPECHHSDLIVGIGDDAAVIRLNDHRALLVTCDIQVEDQHFRMKNISPYQLGRRAMAVNLSDIAAMGGQPAFALVSLGFPGSLPLNDFEELFKGMSDQLSEYSAIIIGGNLSNIESKMVIDVMLMGEVSPSRVLTRSGAKPGNRIFVTGSLGASGAGFNILEKFGPNYPDEFHAIVQKHLQPVPRIAIGQQIAQSGFATAMIDISDGLASDLYHICTMSGVGAEIYRNRIPLPEQMKKIESLTRTSALDLALHSGEDYELLFTVGYDTPDSLIDTIAKNSNVSITEIGRILPKQSGYFLSDTKNRYVPLQPAGWDHFKR